MSTQLRAFRPLAQTQNIAVTTTAQTQALNYTLGTVSVRILVAGGQMVFILPVDIGDVTTAVTPTTGIPIAGGATELISLPSGTGGISIISNGLGSTVYTTVGEGL